MLEAMLNHFVIGLVDLIDLQSLSIISVAMKLMPKVIMYNRAIWLWLARILSVMIRLILPASKC